MMGFELQVGDKFVIDQEGYRKLVFVVLDKDGEEETFTAKLDMSGLPQLERRFSYALTVTRVWDV